MSLVAALLIAATAWLAVPPAGEPRLAAMLGGVPRRERVRLDRSTTVWAAASCAGVGAVVLMPNVAGLLVGGAVLVTLPASVRRLETSGQRREREALSRQAAGICDLMSATLASGAPMPVALGAVADAVPMPGAGVLASVHASLELGADPETAWAPWANDPAVGLIAAAVVRSGRTGAPLATLLSRLAADLRRERRTIVEVAARSAGVRAVLPLAACFLPAFLLLGVVPVVASLATELLSG